MKYQTFSPPEHLLSVIKHFWILENDGSDNSKSTFNAVPNGSPGVIMIRSDKDTFCTVENKKLPNIFLYGQTVAPSSFSTEGKVEAIGICFQPHALKSIFGMDADALTGASVDLTLLENNNNNLSEQLLNAATIDEQIRILSIYLFQQQQDNSRLPDEPIKHAISQLTHTRGNISVKELQQKLNLSERTFERRFKKSVGISPRLFSRIIRFQDTLIQMQSNNYKKLSDVAYENEFVDQSHFIRVFKEFTGFSPMEFKRNNLAR